MDRPRFGRHVLAVVVDFVSASLLLDYGSERPLVAVRPLTAFRRGLSGTGWNDEGVLGRDQAVGNEIDGDVEMRRVVGPSEAFGEVDATDPLAEIEVSSAGWASSV